MALWGGRFDGESDPLFRLFNDSLPIDRVLVEHDITGSIAWAKGLQAAGILDEGELASVVEALEAIRCDARAQPDQLVAAGDEDVHAWVEARLIERVGDLGKKIHTGRSRNDQVATDFRLWMREALDSGRGELRDVQRAFVDLAERTIDVIMPGYTHLQRAQPILFAHWCLAWVEMFGRDASRFGDARARLNECPLGAGALAGSSFPIDRDLIARELGFDRPTANSVDAVASRDLVLEALAAASICALNLSRLAEDLINYASQEFGFVEMSDAVSTGSSIMPQKKNPDAMELIRGKTGRIAGAFNSLAMTVKGLPMAYNKDLQEDKRPAFEAFGELSMCLRVLTTVISSLGVNAERCRAAAEGGYANATELANYLSAKGVPFREAHEVTGRIVRHALAKQCPLGDLSLEELHDFSELFADDVHERLALEAVIARCNVPGGTAPKRVRQALQSARARLDALGD